MAQNNDVAAPVRRYTRMDFTALRYRFNKIPLNVIRDRLYTEDLLSERNLETDAQLAAWLDQLRDSLIERARRANPLVAKNLEDARTMNSWPAGTVNYLVQAGEQDQAAPRRDDSLALWLRPRVSKALAAEGVETIEQLISLIELRGDGWYRPIPRVGRGKAQALERWLIKNKTVGEFRKPADVVAHAQIQLSALSEGHLAPLERISSIVSHLDGSQGRNRATAYCLIAARNDLEAIQSYLYKFRGRDKTLRAYRKELERFLLWCVTLRRTPLSGVLLEECEAYKDFLASPDPRWIGVKVARTSPRWRPFERKLSAESQRYAVQVLRTFFDWLVNVRYLGGNPWATVADPVVTIKETLIDIDKALPSSLWEQLSGPTGILASAVEMTANPQDRMQYRVAQAAIELMGATGIRREEAAYATRGHLKPVPASISASGLWELKVLGKRRKLRTVYIPSFVIEVLKHHWADRGHEFDSVGAAELSLISPVLIPPTPAARAKHVDAQNNLRGTGFSPDGLYQVVKTTLERLANDKDIALTDESRMLISRAAPHALRHTFATRATAEKVPLDVVQRTLGHASQQTTAIYVQAERIRSIEELSGFFAK